MLPILKKTTQQQFQVSQIKLYHPPKQLSNIELDNQRKTSFIASFRNNSRPKVMAAGFRKDETAYESNRINLASRSLQEHNYATMNQQNSKMMAFAKLNSNKDLSAEIKLIQKKIRYHKKKIQEEKKKKQEMQRVKNDPFSQDFQKIIKKQLQMQGFTQQQTEPKGFDYLTNPGKVHQQQQPQQEDVIPELILKPQPKRFDITEKIQKLQKHYENSLKKKFERRQMFPHYPCRRKTPKLYVTTKTNALEKFGKKPPQEEHVFRVMTKECTPQQIYPTIPNFPIVKDNLSKNVLAYLSDFKPFIDKAKQDIQFNDEESSKDENEEKRQQEVNEQGQSQSVN